MIKLRVFSPNKSCAPLRSLVFNKRILLRLGSTTPLISKFKYQELNSINGVKISANKILMKKAFDECEIKHSEWINTSNAQEIRRFLARHKILIVKHRHSSKGEGIYYIDNRHDLETFISEHNIKDYIFEKYYFFPYEYRIHVDVDHGLFYICKKVLKEDAEVQWHKHADNSIFCLVNKKQLDDNLWDAIIFDCQKYMKHINLNICCFDILCANNSYIIVESNTAPSLASNGIMFYSNHLRKYYGN